MAVIHGITVLHLCAILLTYSQLPRQHHYMSILSALHKDGWVRTATALGFGAIVSHEGDGMYRQMVVSYIVLYRYLYISS